MIQVIVKGGRVIHVHQLSTRVEVESVLQAIEDQLLLAFESQHMQAQYNQAYGLDADGLFPDRFNGYMLDLAIRLRGLYGDDISEAVALLGVDAVWLHGMIDNLIHPSQAHVECFSKRLEFPVGFFQREAERPAKQTFACKMPDWA